MLKMLVLCWQYIDICYRYFVIVLPMQSRRRCTAGNTRKVLVLVWVLSVLLSLPALYVKVCRLVFLINYYICKSVSWKWEKGVSTKEAYIALKKQTELLLKLFIFDNERCHTIDASFRISWTPFLNVNTHII